MANILCGPSTNDCLFTVNSSCVIYDGPSTTTIGYVPNMSLTSLLLLIDSKFAGGAGSIFFDDSQTVDILGTGTSADPYSANVIISAQPDNAITIEPDGLYVPTVTIGIPNLQQVTDVGNYTTNPIALGGPVTPSLDIFLFSHTTGGGPSTIVSFDSTAVRGQLRFEDTGASLTADAGVTIIGSLGTSYMAGFDVHLHATNSMIFSTIDGTPTGIPAIFQTRVQAEPAVQPADLVRLDQLPNVSGFVPNTRTLTLTNGTAISITGGTQDLTADRIWTINHADTSTITNIGPLTGPTVISAINFDSMGHATSFTTRALTPADISAVNVYNSNGTLAGNRTISAAGFSFTISGGSAFSFSGTGTEALFTDATSMGIADGLGNLINATSSFFLISSVADMSISSAAAIDITAAGGISITDTTTFLSPTNGQPATAPNQYVTLSQLQSTVSTIVSTSIASSSITQAFMNSNHGSTLIGGRVLYNNLSDDATKVLVMTKLTSTTWSVNADTKLT